MASKNSVKWWAPHWSTVPGMWRVLRECIFNSRTVLRVTLVALVVGGVLIAAAKAAFPALQLGDVWRMLYLLPGMYLLFLFYFSCHMAIPMHVEVRPDWIHWFHGQHGSRVRRSPPRAS